ncbi:MAG TPA: response regulator [Bacteroidota bacterium]
MSQRILVVEDDKSIQSLISYKLKNSGFEVYIAANGAEGLKILETNTVDLILADLMMPVMSGKEFLVAVKKNASTKDIPVVILTAKTLENEVIEGLTLGADDYIKKPFSPSELVARVRNVLSRIKR